MSRRPGEQGLFRGCCLGLVLLLLALGALAFLADRAMAAPDLGQGPAGPSHGSSETQIAVDLGAQLTAELLSNPQGVVTLSEADLTVIADENRPARFQSLQARIRNGQIVVSGPTSEGPFTVTAVAYLTVSLDTTQSPPQFAATVTHVDIGQVGVPGFIQSLLISNVAPSVSVNNLFAEAALRAAESNVECLRVTDAGLVIGVHRPGVTPDPGVCG